MMRIAGLLLLAAALPMVAAAQDTAGAPGVRLGITYNPGMRPRIVILPGALDSARTIVQRDLDYSDLFEVIATPPSQSARGGGGSGELNYQLYRTLGADYGVEIAPATTGVTVRLHDVGSSRVAREQVFALGAPGSAGFRMEVHRISDEVVRWITGLPGIAATRLLLVVGPRVYRVDSDGAGLTPITPEGEKALSPAWSPDGSLFAYTRFENGRGSIVIQDLAGGQRQILASTGENLNITPAFSPDGRVIAFARADEGGTHIYRADATRNCCVTRLTVGRFADNLSPTFSADGRRIAHVSTRSGLPQIYVMDADGTDQELFAPFDYGVTGSSNAPDWSPDGASVTFHRDVSRAPQIFVLDVNSRRVRQLTSSGRNEDPTWAPDGRHIAFVSDRGGRQQLWVIDMETGRIRALPTPAGARL
ncbi:MAG: LpqB family beta-propeller domain-containing protein, partial [Gemmatimonadales bacterium]